MAAIFGKNMLRNFMFADDWTNMNHGSFGSVPRSVQNRLQERQLLVEATPDQFIRYEYNRELTAARIEIAKLVHAPLDTIVLVPNATSGIDTILRNIEYSPGDHILFFDTIYGTCERTALHLAETTAVQITYTPLVYPLSDSALLETFNKTVNRIHSRGERVKIAVFDAISFQPGVRVPFEDLVKACRGLGILSCVDGAHCIGQLPLDLLAVDPDFFVGNLHKWLFVPRGCAVLYAPVRTQQLLRTTFPTGWGFRPKNARCNAYFALGPGQKKPFETLFESFGTMDYSPFLCLQDALAFRQGLGGEAKIMSYNSELAATGGRVMAGILGTKVLDNEEGTLTRGCSMVNVMLPLDLSQLSGNVGRVIEDISQSLVHRYRTYVPIFQHGQHVWVRASAQIYLEVEQFSFLGHALRNLCEDVMRGERSYCAEHRILEKPGELSKASMQVL
ncbi:Hercynylcysteine sulfoxide lyase [Penicillium odoratum]|uniref:Hercynylcysteine sulfoxide lyase n=1 Tax=Penicillium odoratum TaxID=1167516 RepID=UPI00254801EB|nr:Hercynylcysteine sulfoxide lyase [Penicillium odoratum]KAJ5751602.1 Hercynylcysteine sulfoxide lyase [Penicillium odoratum]